MAQLQSPSFSTPIYSFANLRSQLKSLFPEKDVPDFAIYNITKELEVRKNTVLFIAGCILKHSVKELKQKEEKRDPAATLALADIYWFGFKGVEREPGHAIDLYHKAARAGLPEAFTAMAYVCQYSLLAPELNGTVPCKRTQEQEKIVQERWHWLDHAADRGWVSPLLLHLGAEAERTGSWNLSKPVVAALREREKAVELEKQKGLKTVGDQLTIHTIHSNTLEARDLEQFIADADGDGGRGLSALLTSTRNGSGYTVIPHEQLIAQADRLLNRNNHRAALRCLTRAMDQIYAVLHDPRPLRLDDCHYLLLPGRLYNDKSERTKVVQVLRRRIGCNLVLAKRLKNQRYWDHALEDCGFVLHTGIFTAQEFEAQWQELQDLETKAKAMQARGWDVGHGEGGGQQRSQRRKQKKNKKSKSVKPQEPSVLVLASDQLIEAQVAINAKIRENCCSICQTGWNEFETLTLAAVATCGHATCAPCLSRYHAECKKTFETELGDAKTAFRCVICRQPFPRNILSNIATTVVQKNVIPSFRLLIDHLNQSQVGLLECIARWLLINVQDRSIARWLLINVQDRSIARWLLINVQDRRGYGR
ncbi:hypothetical protein HK104_001083 [Borealophlyctis nickersoniae]|nr:hypothetical protein HK104_001083 [Borealophlyctis nickersoniae]